MRQGNGSSKLMRRLCMYHYLVMMPDNLSQSSTFWILHGGRPAWALQVQENMTLGPSRDATVSISCKVWVFSTVCPHHRWVKCIPTSLGIKNIPKVLVKFHRWLMLAILDCSMYTKSKEFCCFLVCGMWDFQIRTFIDNTYVSVIHDKNIFWTKRYRLLVIFYLEYSIFLTNIIW